MYKTIVVHIDGGAAQESRINAATLPAAAHDARYIRSADTGVTPTCHALPPAAIGAPTPFPVSDFAAVRKAVAPRSVWTGH